MLNKSISGCIVVIFLILSLLPIVSCNENNQIKSSDDINNGTLSGYVEDTLMNPIEGAIVRVYFHDTYEENYTDSSGYYHVNNIPICFCIKNATASKEGYSTVKILLSIDEATIYNFVLLPIGKKFYVGGNGPNNYTRIQDAIDVANSGDTIFVYNGTYYENVFVDKQISLIGNSNGPLIDGKGNSYSLKINKSADRCIIEGFEFTNASFGILVKSNCNLINKNIFLDNNIGIYLHYSNSSTIKNNKIFNNKYRGLKINYSDNNHVYENLILNNQLEGIWIFFSYYNSIYNNVVSDNKRGFELGGYKNKIWSNIISNNSEFGIHYWATCANKIYKNNFVGNNEDASFSHIFLIGYSRLIEIFWISNYCWYLNYWNGSRNLPKIIVGNIRFFYDLENIESFTVPWYEFDWLPAKGAYDIPIPEVPLM